MVSEEMKDLYLKDDVYKEYVISFPEDPELRDLTNADLVEESIELIQSICSQNTFQFGLYEANQLSFKTIGIGDITGKKIRLIQRIGEYEWDYGIFQIHTCRREDNRLIRDIVAYSASAEALDADVSELVNDMFRKITTSGGSETIEVGAELWKYRKNTLYEFKRKIAAFIPSLSFSEEQIELTWSEESNIYWMSPSADSGYVSVGKVVYEYTHTVYTTDLDMYEYYRFDHHALDDESKRIQTIWDGISGETGSYVLPVVTIDDRVKVLTMQITEPYEESGDPHPIIDIYTGADSLTIHAVTKVECVTYDEVGQEKAREILYENAKPIDQYIKVYEQRLDPIEYERFTEEIASVSARNAIRSMYELKGDFPLWTGKEIAADQVRYSNSFCYSFMEEEYSTKMYGRICAERKVDMSVEENDRENPLVYYEWDADAPNTYYILDNFVLKSLIIPAGNKADDMDIEEVTIRKILMQISEKLKNLSFIPFTLKCKGLPYVSPGDRIVVELEEGSFESVILERTLSGMHFQTDVLQNNIEEMAQKTALDDSLNITNIVNNSSGSGGGKYEAISVPDLQKILV